MQGFVHKQSCIQNAPGGALKKALSPPKHSTVPWRCFGRGYEKVDVERIAGAVNVTKPALYRAFGDKSTLLLKGGRRALCDNALELPLLAAFQTEPDIRKAVTAFCEAAVDTATGEARGAA